MDFYEEPILVYIKLNDKDEIIDIRSSIFIDNAYEWLMIDSGYGDKYAHAQTQYLEKPIMNNYGEYNYQYIDGAILDKSV